MIEIFVQVRLGMETLFNTKVFMLPDESTNILKKKICHNNINLDEKQLVAVFAGCVMEDLRSMTSFGMSNGAMVHVFKQIKHERPAPPKRLSDVDFIRLGVAFRSLAMNSSYRNALMKFRNPNELNNVILSFPGLNEDPIAITYLQHPELLVKLNDYETIKRIAGNHPALATAVLQMATTVQEGVLQNHSGTEVRARSFNNVSDEDMEDMDDSSAVSGDNTRATSTNYGAITAAQLASAIANVTTHLTQPSTSGASTSTGNTVQSQQSATEINLSTQLQIMRDMGLTNDGVNLEALRLSSDLETAVELVLSGFTLADSDRNNI